MYRKCIFTAYLNILCLNLSVRSIWGHQSQNLAAGDVILEPFCDYFGRKLALKGKICSFLTQGAHFIVLRKCTMLICTINNRVFLFYSWHSQLSMWFCTKFKPKNWAFFHGVAIFQGLLSLNPIYDGILKVTSVLAIEWTRKLTKII